jgi:hypothetical protein
MAIVKTILKKTQTDVVIKLGGVSGDTATIDLDGADVVTSTEVAGAAGSQVVNVIGVSWTGNAEAQVTVTRNSKRIFTLPCGAPNQFDFDGQTMAPDSTENTSDIVVAFTGTGNAEVWLKLRKSSGYDTKIETGAFGVYDDTTVVGS